MASYKDIAALSGLSIGTVSNVIQGKRTVKSENIDKVNAAIETLNYRVNYQARSLASETSKIIGLIFVSPETPSESKMLLKFEDLAGKYGYQILWATTRLSATRERRSCEEMLSRKVDGLFIFSQSVENKDYFKRLAETEKTPIILVGRYFSNVELPTVAVDNQYSARVLVDYLYQKGYRKVCYLDISEEEEVSPNRDRRNGIISRCNELDIACTVLRYSRAENDYTVGFTAAEEMIFNGTLPEIVIPRDDSFALGFYNGCIRHGYRIPEDVSILSFGKMYGDRITPKKLTTYDPMFNNVVKKSFDIFLKLCEVPYHERCVVSQSKYAGKVFIKGKLIEGETVRDRSLE